MKIPVKILRRMRYYKEIPRTEGEGTSHPAHFSEFVLAMPWYRPNVRFRLRWAFSRENNKRVFFQPSNDILEMRKYLDEWIEMRDAQPAKAETQSLIARLTGKIKHD